jgi:CubicO group peptidase (beta-lactamase class C family)
MLSKFQLLNLMDAADIPGISIAYISSKETFSMDLGIISKNSATHVGPNSAFGAASLSKPIFAYLVLKLITANNANTAKPGLGKFKAPFDLDTPLYEVYPALLNKFRKEDEGKAKSLTTRIVLSHMTGLPITHHDSNGPIQFQFEPNTQYGYSGPAINYLQEVIEELTKFDLETLAKDDKLTQPNLETLAKEHVFTPLEMDHSTFEPKKEAANSLRTTTSDYAKFIMERTSL